MSNHPRQVEIRDTIYRSVRYVFKMICSLSTYNAAVLLNSSIKTVLQYLTVVETCVTMVVVTRLCDYARLLVLIDSTSSLALIKALSLSKGNIRVWLMARLSD